MKFRFWNPLPAKRFNPPQPTTFGIARQRAGNPTTFGVSDPNPTHRKISINVFSIT